MFHGLEVASAAFGSRSASDLLNRSEPKMVESGDRKGDGSDLWIIQWLLLLLCGLFELDPKREWLNQAM